MNIPVSYGVVPAAVTTSLSQIYAIREKVPNMESSINSTEGSPRSTEYKGVRCSEPHRNVHRVRTIRIIGLYWVAETKGSRGKK